MAGTDDEIGLGLGSPVASSDHDEAQDGGDGDSASESPMHICAGCDIASKTDCPVTIKKNPTQSPMPKVKWAKTTTRRVLTKSKRRVKKKQRCGEWCGGCHNLVRRWCGHKKYRKLLASHGKKVCAAQVRQDVKEPGEFRERFKNAADEAIRLLAGGRSRIRGGTDVMTMSNETRFKLKDAEGHFYTVARYTRDFGCPKAMKARVILHPKYGEGVIVLNDFDGKIPMSQSSCQVLRRESRLGDGQVLDEQELEDTMAAAVEDCGSALMAGALNLADTNKRAEQCAVDEVAQAQNIQAAAAAAATQQAAVAAGATPSLAQQPKSQLADGTISSDGDKSSGSSGDDSSEDSDKADDTPPVAAVQPMMGAAKSRKSAARGSNGSVPTPKKRRQV